MELSLVVKVIGGIITAMAHRTLVRSAKEEGTAWWLTTMCVPGGSIVYGLVNFQALWGVLAVQCAGLMIVGIGFGLGIYTQFTEAKELAKSELHESDEVEEAAENEPEQPPQMTLLTLPAATPANPAPSNRSSVPKSPTIPNRALPGDLRERLVKLEKRHQKLIQDRAALKVNDESAVRAFNLRAAEYHEILARLRAEVAKLSTPAPLATKSAAPPPRPGGTPRAQ